MKNESALCTFRIVVFIFTHVSMKSIPISIVRFFTFIATKKKCFYFDYILSSFFKSEHKLLINNQFLSSKKHMRISIYTAMWKSVKANR